MSSSTAPRKGSPSPAHPALRWSNWNLLLIVPLVALVTPLYNKEEPRLLGFPLFYWLQFLFIPLGVLCVAVVYHKTRNVGGPVDRDAVDGDAVGGALR
ncbi:MAG TPA: DUF3311 domain-containing protein [Pseudonocardiaceae bacterium]|jgi:hypothetical protein|nr:DUF3311 domain-containing protein [Pseudonocardiaceae bacterium]